MPTRKLTKKPMVKTPARELWLYKNPEIYATVLLGLSQSKKGKVSKQKRDFTKS